MKVMSFSEWVKLRGNSGKPHSPRSMDKIPHQEKKSPGSRSIEDDLSSDYVGHVGHNGEVAPYKLVQHGKKSG